MSVALKGSSPAALTAGILLLSRARSFGQRLNVEIVGDPDAITPVRGPALVHSAVLASCGVGRELGAGALVILPGPPTDPLATSLSPGGMDGWFYLDRSGEGTAEATQAFVRLCRARSGVERNLGRGLWNALDALGCPAEPALLDLLAAAPAPPLVRLALVLRAGRAMSGGSGQPITRYLASTGAELPDALSSEEARLPLAHLRTSGRLDTLLDRVSIRYRGAVEQWLEDSEQPARNDAALAELRSSLLEVGSHLASLPAQAMLPPLHPAMDGVATGLSRALGATTGEADATRGLVHVFRFLGGRFTDDAAYPVDLPGEAPPEDRLARWQWFCRSCGGAAETADALWRRVTDFVS